jgi:hypothetical protein
MSFLDFAQIMVGLTFRDDLMRFSPASTHVFFSFSGGVTAQA